jgi:hypothetical protein
MSVWGNPVDSKEAKMTTEERLEKLERELTLAKRHNHWLLAIAGLIVLTMVLAMIFSGGDNTALAQGARSEGKVVRANKFILEDEKGKPRALLIVHEGEPSLGLFDDKGQVRTWLGIPGLASLWSAP